MHCNAEAGEKEHSRLSTIRFTTWAPCSRKGSDACGAYSELFKLELQAKERRGMSMNRPADSYKGLLVEQLWHLVCFTEQEQGFLAECYPTHHNSSGVGSWNRIIHAGWCAVVSWSVYIQTETVVNSGELPASTPTVRCWALNCLLDFRPCWTAPTCRARQQLCFFSLCPCHLYASVVTGSLQSPIYKQSHSNS